MVKFGSLILPYIIFCFFSGIPILHATKLPSNFESQKKWCLMFDIVINYHLESIKNSWILLLSYEEHKKFRTISVQNSVIFDEIKENSDESLNF